MDKEEILKRAQSEQVDEREVQVKDKSMMWSYIVMVLAAGVFSFIRAKQGQPMMDLTATVCFSVFANQIYRFIKTKDKQYLFIATIMIGIGIVATIRYMMGH